MPLDTCGERADYVLAKRDAVAYNHAVQRQFGGIPGELDLADRSSAPRRLVTRARGLATMPEDLDILTAVETGDLEDVRRLLAADPSVVHARSLLGDQPLHLAAFQDQQEVVEMLLGHGADINARGQRGWTPLHHAASSCSLDTAYVLIRRGADLNARDEQGYTLAYHAVNNQPRDPYGATALLGLLLRAGADLDLHTAICLGMTAVVRDLLTDNPGLLQAEPNAPDFLSSAVLTQKEALVQLLIARGADVNAFKDGPLPLQAAVGLPWITELLLRQGANPRLRRLPNEDSPLEWATKNHLEKELELYARYA